MSNETTEPTAGMIEIAEDDLVTAIEVYGRMTADDAFKQAVLLAVEEGFTVIEAAVQVRRKMMSICLGKQLKVSMDLLEKFEGHGTWQGLVDTLIRIEREIDSSL